VDGVNSTLPFESYCPPSANTGAAVENPNAATAAAAKNDTLLIILFSLSISYYLFNALFIERAKHYVN
jgi:hypothetical protein